MARPSQRLAWLMAMDLLAGSAVRAQAPADVGQLLCDAALKDLVGHRTQWRVKMTTHGIQAIVDLRINELLRRQAEAVKRGDLSDSGSYGPQIKALQERPLTTESEADVTAQFMSIDDWKIVWRWRGLPESTRTEITSYERGVVVELQQSNKKVTGDPWPLLGNYMRGVPSVFAAARIHASAPDLAFDPEGNLRFTDKVVLGQTATVTCERGRFVVTGVTGTDARGVVRERLSAFEKGWIWETVRLGTNGAVLPFQRQEWVMTEHVPIPVIDHEFGNPPPAEVAVQDRPKNQSVLRPRPNAPFQKPEETPLPTGAGGMTFDPLLLGTPVKSADGPPVRPP